MSCSLGSLQARTGSSAVAAVLRRPLVLRLRRPNLQQFGGMRPVTAAAGGSPSRQPVEEHAAEASSSSSSYDPSDGGAYLLPNTAALAAFLFFASDAVVFAEESGVAYNNSGGEEILKNAAGIGYVALVAFFLYRLLRRRAKRAKEQKIAGQTTPEEYENSWFNQMRKKLAPANPEVVREAGPWDALLGAGQAAALGFGLYLFSTKVSDIMATSPLPDQYTARNISITVRTMIQGLSWLATFIFLLNAVGLAGLTVQMLLFPDSIKEDEAARAALRAARGPQLPKVSITANPQEIKQAFAAAERMGKEEAEKERQRREQEAMTSANSKDSSS